MRVAVLNSRKPRGLEPDAPWLRQTFLLAASVARRGDVLCTSVGTLPYEVALYGAARAGGRLEVLVGTRAQEAYVASLLPEPCAHSNDIQLQIKEIDAVHLDASRDKAVIDGVDLAIAVAVRAGGHMEALLKARWLEGRPVSVVAPHAGDPQTRGNLRLLEAGVPLLAAFDPEIQSGCTATSSTPAGVSPARFPRWSESPLHGPTLAHFTRACDGPWPGQLRRDYLEDLWQGGRPARRDASASLERILGMGRILASGRLIRGGAPVVSLTAVAPHELLALHRYRRHLLRWDFVPSGLVFAQEALERLGARPVRYLPPSAFAGLPLELQPFFQKHVPPDCDYSAELEWRLVGDLELSAVPAELARIYTAE